jgi:hypothetical protein
MSTALDSLFSLLDALPDWLSLALFSGVLGIVLIWAFGKVSPQQALERTKRRMAAGIFEMRLYQDSLGLMLSALWAVLRANAVYLVMLVLPFALLSVPLIPVLVYLDGRFGIADVDPGHPVLITIVQDKPGTADGRWTLHAPQGVKIEAGPVRIDSRGEVDWRISARPGAYRLAFENRNGERAERRLFVGHGSRHSKVRTTRKQSLFNAYIDPVEHGLSSDVRLRTIFVDYQRQDLVVGSHSVPWWAVFLIASMGTGYALKGPLGVTI